MLQHTWEDCQVPWNTTEVWCIQQHSLDYIDQEQDLRRYLLITWTYPPQWYQHLWKFVLSSRSYAYCSYLYSFGCSSSLFSFKQSIQVSSLHLNCLISTQQFIYIAIFCFTSLIILPACLSKLRYHLKVHLNMVMHSHHFYISYPILYWFRRIPLQNFHLYFFIFEILTVHL